MPRYVADVYVIYVSFVSIAADSPEHAREKLLRGDADKLVTEIGTVCGRRASNLYDKDAKPQPMSRGLFARLFGS